MFLVQTSKNPSILFNKPDPTIETWGIPAYVPVSTVLFSSQQNTDSFIRNHILRNSVFLTHRIHFVVINIEQYLFLRRIISKE